MDIGMIKDTWIVRSCKIVLPCQVRLGENVEVQFIPRSQRSAPEETIASEKKLSRDRIGGVEEFVNAGFVAPIRGRPAEKKGRHVMDDMRVLDRIQYACE